MSNDTTRYNVCCLSCDQVWTPPLRSPLWWRAKKHADSGRLDAIHVQGEECGCIPAKREPNAPFRVFGYDMDCRDFDIPFESFGEAVLRFLKIKRDGLCEVFITGISKKLEERLNWS